ncbi:hypothetical protein AVEN_151698-1 [Araneus ventricosus]|uniref:Uncharacterized protein n=1 Tax=Araneus ventricosus TaxID=182803 RepID=A0A4Y2MRC9_ARAVE|nr:hypothetical protein AVEN_151698-1 [Araneus ventricosus]
MFFGRTSDTKWNLRYSRPSGTGLVCWNTGAILDGPRHFELRSDDDEVTLVVIDIEVQGGVRSDDHDGA